jgi:hypothetical protein
MPVQLEIHHVTVKGGDCTVIVVRDETGAIEKSVLIDAGAESKGSFNMAAYISSLKLDSPGRPGGAKTLHFDYFIATHYHSDHIAGITQTDCISFTTLIDCGGYAKAKFQPRYTSGNATYQDKLSEDQARQNIQFLAPVPDPPLAVGPHVIDLGHGIKLSCVAGGGMVAVPSPPPLGGMSEEPYDGLAVHTLAPKPNDLSLVFLLEWGDFRYLTAGDLGGDPKQTAYANIEKALGPSLQKLGVKSVSVFKASHHGSDTSNSLDFLNQISPTIIVVPCNSLKRVPGSNFIDRLTKVPSLKGVYFVNDLDEEKKDAKGVALTALMERFPGKATNLKSELDRVTNDKDTSAIVVVVGGSYVPRATAGGPDVPVGTIGDKTQTKVGYDNANCVNMDSWKADEEFSVYWSTGTFRGVEAGTLARMSYVDLPGLTEKQYEAREQRLKATMEKLARDESIDDNDYPALESLQRREKGLKESKLSDSALYQTKIDALAKKLHDEYAACLGGSDWTRGKKKVREATGDAQSYHMSGFDGLPFDSRKTLTEIYWQMFPESESTREPRSATATRFTAPNPRKPRKDRSRSRSKEKKAGSKPVPGKK